MPILFFFFFNDTATTEIYTLSLHDALPIWPSAPGAPASRLLHRDRDRGGSPQAVAASPAPARLRDRSSRRARSRRRSEEHTSELQSPCNLVCRLLLEKKKTSSC